MERLSRKSGAWVLVLRGNFLIQSGKGQAILDANDTIVLRGPNSEVLTFKFNMLRMDSSLVSPESRIPGQPCPQYISFGYLSCQLFH